MDQRRGALRIAVFRLNFMLERADGGDLPRPDANTTRASELQSAKQEESPGLRILTDPDAAAEPLLRLRQDQRIGLLSLSDPGNTTGTVTHLKVHGSLAPKDTQ